MSLMKRRFTPGLWAMCGWIAVVPRCMSTSSLCAVGMVIAASAGLMSTVSAAELPFAENCFIQTPSSSCMLPEAQLSISTLKCVVAMSALIMLATQFVGYVFLFSGRCTPKVAGGFRELMRIVMLFACSDSVWAVVAAELVINMALLSGCSIRRASALSVTAAFLGNTEMNLTPNHVAVKAIEIGASFISGLQGANTGRLAGRWVGELFRKKMRDSQKSVNAHHDLRSVHVGP